MPTRYGYPAWTLCAIRMRPAPASARRSWPGATSDSRRSTSCSSASPRGRPERSVVLTGLRGVGKTVLLNTFAPRPSARLGHRQDRGPARPGICAARSPSALHMAVREIAPPHRDPERVDEFLGVLKAFALRDHRADKGMRDRWQPGIDVPAAKRPRRLGRPRDRPDRAVHRRGRARRRRRGRHRAVHRRDAGPRRRRRVRALRRLPRAQSADGAPLIVVGAGPAAPARRAVGVASRYSERLFRYHRIDRLDREAADRALIAPAEREERRVHRSGAGRAVRSGRRLPVLRPGLRQGHLGSRAGQPDHRRGRRGRRARGRGGTRGRLLRLPVRARDPRRTRVHARHGRPGSGDDGPVATVDGRRRARPQAGLALPRPDGLIKKGLIYSAERGTIAFTVPHFGRYLRSV